MRKRSFLMNPALWGIAGLIAGATAVEWQHHKTGENVVVTASRGSTTEVILKTYERMELFGTPEEAIFWNVGVRTYRGSAGTEFFLTSLQISALARELAEANIVYGRPKQNGARPVLEIKNGRLVIENLEN